jgi:hypothetical protein
VQDIWISNVKFTEEFYFKARKGLKDDPNNTFRGTYLNNIICNILEMFAK